MGIFYKKGITALEIIISVAILGLLIAVVVPALISFRNVQVLKNTTDDIVSLLNEARAQTLSSKNSTFYSVHFETSRAVLFTGGTFAEPNASNKEISFVSAVLIPVSGGINLAGGGSDVSFDRLTGDTADYGTIIVRLASDSAQSKTITITRTGIISRN